MSPRPGKTWTRFGSRAVLLAAALALAATALDARTGRLAVNTLLLVGGTCLLCLPAGTVLAVMIRRTGLPGRGLLVAVLGWMLLVPLYLHAAGWLAGFGPMGWLVSRGGPVLLDGWFGAWWIHATAALPWVVLIVGLGLRTVEASLEDEARLYAGPWRVLCRVTLRRAAPAMAVAALWVTVAAAGEMTVTDLLRIRTYAEEVYTEFAIEPGATPLAFWPGMALVGLLVLAGWALCRGLSPRGVPMVAQPLRPFELGPARWPAAVVLCMGVVALAAVPLANLVHQAGIAVEVTATHRVRTWSLEQALLRTAQSPVRHAWPLGFSALIATVAATASTAAALWLAWRAARPRGRRGLTEGIVAVLLAVPGPVLGIGLVWLFSRDLPGLPFLYDQTILAPALAQALRALPLPTFVLWHGLRSVPVEQLEAAATDGATSAKQLWRVALPQRRAALLQAWLVAWLIAWSELAATILVSPPGVMTLPVEIFHLLHWGMQGQVAALCLAQFAVLAAAAAVVLVSARRWLAPAGGGLRG